MWFGILAKAAEDWSLFTTSRHNYDDLESSEQEAKPVLIQLEEKRVLHN